MQSLILTKEKRSKNWRNPIFNSLLIFLIIQAIGYMLFSIIFKNLFGKDGESLANLYSFLISLIGIIYINKNINHRTTEALGFFKKNWLINYIKGISFGIIMLILVVGLSYLSGIVNLTISSNISWPFIFLLLVGFMIQGMTEEVVVRGYVQNGVAAHKGILFGLFTQAIVFSLFHAFNPGMTFLPLINLFVVGILFGLVFIYTDNMWVIGGMHFAWNFLLGPILGIEVSGVKLPTTVLQTILKGNSILTGGKFGIEGSMLTTLVVVVGIAFLWKKLRKNAVL